MKRSREINVFSVSFLDLLSGALGAVIILFVSVPKAKNNQPTPEIKPPPPIISETVVQNQNEKIAVQNEEIEKLKKQIESMKLENKIEKIEPQIPRSTENGLPVDVGFKFKGKTIVFLIDISGSMNFHDKIGQVKAGLKMLITSMGDDYSIDIVAFPGKQDRAYQALWGIAQPLSRIAKLDAYRFLENMNPYGSTPTRNALRYALAQYGSLTDIVLLSDGVPTKLGVMENDNTYEIINEVKQLNTANVQINTIGVGPDFINNSTSPKAEFLQTLSQENKGFFHGF